ncbi:HopJ type III effector protein [Pseudoalteromonas obscura]|uniref:HopJ type III effector protein n=1 Tax=Pseudoalteromonas obscura TaxID=3048491 RepID=A0ABT7EFM6_9GAMM|nr:HopJ type III effector protein [Pseudoalteromonas sp. P94(2023)]MDK2594085.1 HopJ type III effector protein [Pseudoalteromonas sp. P94(2023)]
MANIQSESVERFISRVTEQGESVEFEQTISLIDTHFEFTPTSFTNGEQENEAGTNLGSCKILAFAKLHGLSEQATLHCFGRYYRQDVLENPTGDDHGNIRNFMKFGWKEVSFSEFPLSKKINIQ